MELLEDVRLGPLDEAAIAGAAAAELTRDGVPLAAGAQAIDDSGENPSVVQATRSATLTPLPRRNPPFHALPEIVGYFSEIGLHGPVEITSQPAPQVFHKS